MINHPPENWKYNDSMEMLFLFYQCSDELLSDTTPDSYALPLHNTFTLLQEMDEIYDLLEHHDAVDKYYSSYIPPIIEEFLFQTEEDYLFKQMMGDRLESIRAGFKTIETESSHFKMWVGLALQMCRSRKYLSLYKNEIIRLITYTRDKTKLLYCIANYFITLRWIGYSREYLYKTTKKFFSDQGKIIDNENVIKDFLDLFSGKMERYDFLMLLDIDPIEYMDSISEKKILTEQIEKVDISKERSELAKDNTVLEMLKEYDSRVNNTGAHTKIAIVRFYNNDYDPYSIVKDFCDYISFIQSFAQYFKHFFSSKQVYKILLKQKDGHYQEIKLPRKLQKRPFVEQPIIDSRIRNLLNVKDIGFSAFQSIAQAFEMHAEAYDSKNTLALLKTFWTALETLFSNPNPTSVRENVINSVLSIIEKTYLLKKLRAIYAQLVFATSSQKRIELGINSFQSFLKYYASHALYSHELRNVYSLLRDNPLLRTRLFSFRKSINSGKTLEKILANHNKRIEWQLKRLYRIRNIATHLGARTMGVEIAANHLHNYFDFVVNYMLCKSENGDYVSSTAAVVFEAKNDNQIYHEMLKTEEELSGENYLKLLFGPDKNLVNYHFEH